MATCVQLVGTADTGASPNTTGSFVPAEGDLLVVFCAASGTTDSTATATGSSGPTFQLLSNPSYSSSSNSLYAWVANSRITAAQAISMTITCDMPADGSTGTVIMVYAIRGMQLAGLSSLRSSGSQANQAAGGTPTVTMSLTAHPNNPILGFVANNSSPAGMTPPSDFTETAAIGDLGYGSPTTGGACCHRNTGHASNTVTWGSTSATVFASIALEFLAPPSGRQKIVSQSVNRASTY